MSTALRAFGLITAAAGVLASVAPNVIAAEPPPAPSAPASVRVDDGESHRLLTSVRLDNGTVFEFVRSSDGTVGVAEISPLDVPSRLNDLTARQDGTALEVFRTVAPAGQKAPAELVADHEKVVKSERRPDATPRNLTLAPTPLGAVDETYDQGQCDYNTGYTPGNSQFTWQWFWTLGKFKDFTYQQSYFPADLDGTSGREWYAGVTRQRWLGACNGNYIFGFPDFDFRAQYRHDGVWYTAYHTQLSPQYKVVYSSSYGPQRWRVQLAELGYNVMLNREYAVAVAGNNVTIGGVTIGD